MNFSYGISMTFASLGLIEPLLRALEALGYQTPTPVQTQAIPPVLAGRDLMAAAQTGTGKTAGFALPLLQRLTMEGPKVAPNCVRALVLAPTRELADQVHESIRQYAEHLPLSTYAAYGGVSINPQMMKLRKGVDVLVATPGRLLDLHRQNAVKFSQLQTLILDEADRMLDLGFAEELRGIYAVLPKQRQTLLFSATFSDEIRLLAAQMLNDPLTIEVSPRNVAASSVKQWVVTVDKKRKADLFIHLMKKHRWGQVLVFAKTRVGVDQLVDRLQGLGLNADGIHGDKPQATRQRALDRFKSNEVKILVATDVAARGLDIDDLPTVVNLDLPIVAEDYIHRIGRTGRAGLTGEAISLVCADEVELLSAIEVLTRQTLERKEEQDFEPEHRVPTTDASGQILKKPKKPKKPKVSGSKRNLGKWVDSGESEPAPAVKPIRKVPVFNTGPRKKKP
ncbi:putative ATP-dependent RNA helicase rhlE [Pseudomonas savastanoi pv. nerii]|uniref:DEAD-box ATP-dependent RNA helicase RhpA n=9 Tax=Pseudomonas syringae group TaxID=136849 RepID=A0A0P9V6U3_9PSED|nr:putative ATP-dependent RNA helicase rhlE [Pseudomonas amygdali pv. ciccaronei]KPW99706.1 ATP-dependent RNA helicase rhlE [Pseudomonas syringae pv. cerasicola]KPX16296.1 ATP-dependent RNA helicase rhlE [Pseudomonas syringae pv. daphniphylli]KPX79702.1 ATP-dependent RNA helicase rhlE [Pseudomonas amygdali pv. photiniae]KPX79833.1 putative ATP-dependent RNA helicase rhlE [Pseudomonas meliae]KPY11245.1 putative ATP-dependent RNA helicase rhlE [Pseudomonas savastanoi pv. nerii]KPY35231.1 putati